MNIFSEIYGAYFLTAEKILSHDTITEKEINTIIEKNAFSDSMLFIPEKIFPQKSGTSSYGNSPWGLLKRNPDGSFSSVLTGKPPKTLTKLQKRWLKSKLADPKFRLFMDDETLDELSEFLENVKPLYDSGHFRFFDVFTDGDDFTDERYRSCFRKILSAVNKCEIIRISGESRRGARMNGCFLPIKIEYSGKNNKFRVYCLTMQNDFVVGKSIFNIGRITEIRMTGQLYKGEINHESYFSSRRCSAPVTLEISNERNGLERFMMEFASYEKRCELDLNTGKCKAELWYDIQDETELLIQLIGFGPVLKINGPPEFRSKVAERVRKQYALIFKENEASKTERETQTV